LVEPDQRIDYREIRLRLIGLIEDRVYVVIFTMRVEKLASFPPEGPTAVSKTTTIRARLVGDKVYIINSDGTESPAERYVDYAKVDATTEEDIARHIVEDEAEVRADAAAHIRSIRARTGLSQPAFAQRLRVSVETLRNWEQGKRHPQGPARALLRIIDKAPEAAMAALDDA
jgi:putative transcriptional regulator